MNSPKEELYVGADLHSSNILLSLADNNGIEILKKRVKSNISDVDKILSISPPLPRRVLSTTHY